MWRHGGSNFRNYSDIRIIRKGSDRLLRLILLLQAVVVRTVHGTMEVLLRLHPSVLEPDFDLSLGKAQRVGNFDSPPASQVAIEVELLLQLQRLELCVGLAGSL